MDIAHARLRGQHISRPAATVQEAVRSLGAIQGQDYAASLWAVGLRTKGSTSRTVEAAIENGSIVRTWPMRGTLHLVPASDARWMLELLGAPIAAAHARRFLELGIDDALVSKSQLLMSEALSGGQRLTRERLYEVLREAGVPAGQVSYYLLWRAALDRLVCIGPRQGKQQTFVLFEEWIPRSTSLPREEGLARIATLYFSSHGPATLQDFGWWSGLKAADARLATASAEGIVSRTFNGQEYWFASDAFDSLKPSRATFVLPAFDEYLVAYRDRTAVLSREFTRTVNAGGGLLEAVVVRGGQVVGTWKRQAQGKRMRILVKPFGSASDPWKEDVQAAFRRYLRFISIEAEVVFLPPVAIPPS